MEENSSNPSITEQFTKDEFYNSFLKNDVKSSLVKSLSVTEQVQKLGEGIELLNQELSRQVLEKHEDLLSQANHATKLENVLNEMNGHVQNLFANAERLRNQIIVPYNALETHTLVLSRLHLASHILRQVHRIQQLSKRLGNTNDPVQKATILQELEQLAIDPELKDIDVVTAELRNIRAQQQKVVKLAAGSLNQGILNENFTQTTTALQIFVNLGTVNETLDGIIDQNLSEVRDSLRLIFENASGISQNTIKGKSVKMTSSQGFRTKIWTELERIFCEDLLQTCSQIKFLQNTVNRLNTANLSADLAKKFWSSFGNILQQEIQNAQHAIVQMLEEEYPKLLKNYFGMTKKLNYDQFTLNRTVLEKHENSYLSSSLTRLLDPTQAMFGNSEHPTVPNQDQIDALIRVISGEISVALIEEQLSIKICKNVEKSLKMFAVKCEQQLETGADAAQVIGGNLNSGQQKNVHSVNSLYYMQIQVQRMLLNMKESLPESGQSIINQGLTAIQNLVAVIIEPLIVSINSVIETIIVTIHVEPDWNKVQAPLNRNVISCSPYMRELNQFITRVFNTYLKHFDHKEVLFNKCSEIAIRSIELLVRHSVLLRPVSPGGRLRLQADYLQLEQSLKTICPQLSDLGRPYRLLKSLALLIVMSPAEIVASQMQGGSSVPHSTVLLLLFSFGGPELASPHQNTGWSLPKLSAWLDEHPKESDRLDLVAGALQRYEGVVRVKNSTNYDPVYPLMAQLLEAALKEV